jgi:hypothetical protein
VLGLGSLAALLLNDWWLKPAWGGWATGKLSDIAGLAFLLVLLVGLFELASARRDRPWRPTAALVLSLAALLGAAFALTKCTAQGAHAFGIASGAAWWIARALSDVARLRGMPAFHRQGVAVDPSDLIALPFLAATAWYLARRAESIQL